MLIDESYLKTLRLQEIPDGHLFCARIMRVNYRWLFGARVKLEGLENLPKDHSVLIAMNHTDRYTCWPFQYALIEAGGHRFTSTWIKAKYYQNALSRWVFDHCNGIPVPSRGYLILQEAKERLGRMLTQEEYRAIRIASEQDPKHSMSVLNDRLMHCVEEKTLEALENKKNHVLVFPQGTRSKRLLPSRIGMIQMAYKHQIPIIPVGASGCDTLYPGPSPWARPGRVTYRIGKPLIFKGPQDFKPFTGDAKRYETLFEKSAWELTREINQLLDSAYQLEINADFKTWAPDRLL
ncbi:MAG: lysophospholipid acyltransferase family protein [Myxococcaceae bacterium]